MKTKQILIGAAIIGGAVYLYNRNKNTAKTSEEATLEVTPVEDKGKNTTPTSIKDKAASVKGANTKVLKSNVSKRRSFNPSSLRGRMLARRNNAQAQTLLDLGTTSQDTTDENASFAFNGHTF